MNIHLDLNQLLTVTFTLFAVIDIIGSIPLLHALKKKIGGLHEAKATLISGALMVLFLFVGEQFLNILGLDQRSFRRRRLYRDLYPGPGNGTRHRALQKRARLQWPAWWSPLLSR
ncbi:MarC family protein [Puia sp. P3]|uniref:MarC family protein n=1 Tax=Puia sp. P3 TaxID=3423952 RepID=UPI003D6702AE